MSDIEINVSGTMTSHPMTKENSASSSFQIPQALSVRAWMHQCYANMRPWTSFFNTARFKAPTGVPQLTKRIVKNAAYFLSNYVVIVFVLTLYCLLTTPLLFLAVCCSLFACYSLSRRHAERPLVVLGHPLSLQQQYALVAGCSLPLFVLAGAGSAVFWVLGASLFFTSLHAVFYNIAALTPDDEDQFEGVLEQI